MQYTHWPVHVVSCSLKQTGHQDEPLNYKPSFRIEGNLSDLEDDMVVASSRANLSISENSEILRFSHITVSRVYREWSEKEREGGITTKYQKLSKKQKLSKTLLEQSSFCQWCLQGF